MIPPRKSAAGQESPGSTSLWSSLSAEKRSISGSVGSVNMLDSGDSDGDSSEDEVLSDPDEDPMIMTPQVYKLSSNTGPFNPLSPFAPAGSASPGGDQVGLFSPAAASLMSFQRARLKGRKSRHSSSSASGSGNDSMASPSPTTPPVRNMEGVGGTNGNGYFAKKGTESRRGSISWGTRELHLSGGDSGKEESDDGGANGPSKWAEGLGISPSNRVGKEEKRGVIRRAVTRRGNMLVSLR